MAKLVWVLAGLAAAISTLGATLFALSVFWGGSGMSAPQEAATAGLILAFAVPPYLLARAISYMPPWVRKGQEGK